MRTQTTYNKVVNFDKETKEIKMLDYSFKHEGGFKGLTGSTFEPISKKEYKRMTTLAAIEDVLEDAVCEADIPSKYLYTETERLAKNPYKRWAKAIKEAGEEGQFIFDTSYQNLWDSIREQTGLSEDEAFIFNCMGGGRCFDVGETFNLAPELEYLLKEFEE